MVEAGGKMILNLIGSFAIAFSMYSSIPMVPVEWTRERMKYSMCFFPLIGAVIGFLQLLLHFGCSYFDFPYFGKLFAVALPILVTGGIHMDGLLDVIDARSSHMEKDKKLEILKDSHTGAFAIIGCGVYLILYTAAVWELKEKLLPGFYMIFILTRALSGLSVVSFPMAKESGLAASFSSTAHKGIVGAVMVLYLILAEAGILYFCGIYIAGGVAFIALFVYWRYYVVARKEFGGMTGDLAGYFLQVCELSLVLGLAFLSHMV